MRTRDRVRHIKSGIPYKKHYIFECIDIANTVGDKALREILYAYYKMEKEAKEKLTKNKMGDRSNK